VGVSVVTPLLVSLHVPEERNCAT